MLATTQASRKEMKMADPTSFEWELQDDQGLHNRVQMYVAYDGATETVDSLIGAWAAFGGLIDPCIDAKIIGGRMTVPLVRPTGTTWKASPVNGNNCNQVMNLNFGNDFSSYRTSILLPAYKESQVNSTPPKAPNLSATALAALIAGIIAGSGAVFPNSRDLHDLNALLDAFLTTRKVRGQRSHTLVTP